MIKLIELLLLIIIVYFFVKLFPFFKNILSFVFKVTLPFLLGFTIAFIFEPLIEKLSKKINRKIIVIIINAILIGGIIIFVRFFVPFLIKQLNAISDQIPSYIDQIKAIFAKFEQKINHISKNYELDYNKIEELLNDLITKIINNLGGFIQRSFSYIFSIFMTPILAIYFMNYYEKVEEFIKKHTMNKKPLYDCLKEIKTSLHQYVKGVLIVMSILSLVTFITFKIIGLEYAFLLALLIGITDIIPYVGPYIGGAIAGIFTLATKPEKFIYVIISIVITQLLESNYLVPKIQSKTLKTNPLIVLFSIAFFGELFGILGILIAVPMSRIIEIIFFAINQTKKT